MQKPVPVPDALTEPFWRAAQAGRLVVQRCASCGHWQYPPAWICCSCQGDDLSFEDTTGRGTLYSFCETNRAYIASYIDDLPYLVALVELSEQPGLVMLTNLVEVGSSKVEIGLAVEFVAETRGDFTIPQFRPRRMGAGG